MRLDFESAPLNIAAGGPHLVVRQKGIVYMLGTIRAVAKTLLCLFIILGSHAVQAGTYSSMNTISGRVLLSPASG